MQPSSNDQNVPPVPTQETTSQPIGNTPSQPGKRKFHTKTWLLITVGIILVIAIAAAICLYYKHHHKQPPVASTTNAATHAPNMPAASLSQPSNTWKGTISPAAIPLGDGNVSTTPKVGSVDSCNTNFSGGGAQHIGTWVNSTQRTWDSETKPAVEGSDTWSNASYTNTVSGSNRVITTNDLPVDEPTGNFPIAMSDPAHQYDANPNHIGTQTISYTLPLNPTAATTPSCTGLGPIGVMTDGVLLFNALDADGRDAAAHEVQDLCDGHPDGSSEYHYHSVSSCLLKKATSTSTLVGYAVDGYGIYVERDTKGNLPTDADLDACHGRTSPVMWDGKLTTMYHYDATLEYPYTVGCYHGTPVNTHTGAPSNNKNTPPPRP